MRRTLLLGVALLVPMLVFGIGATDIGADGNDDEPCDYPRWHNGQQRLVQDCPLWRGNVPVLAGPSPSAEVVGYLNEGGMANWFVCQEPFWDQQNVYSYGEYRNHWYAWTMADNGQWGWVPEVFFAGGDNYERDDVLYTC